MTAQFARRAPHRAQQILSAVTRRYPDAWRHADELRQHQGREVPRWPWWCYLPLHGAYAIVSGGGESRVPIERSHHIGIVAALAAWRMTQSVYRYDATLARALDDTTMPSDLPTDVLYRLPEWCAYLETPGLRAPDGRPLAGAWVHLDWDQGGSTELRLLLDVDGPLDDAWHSLIPLPLILGQGSIVEALDRVMASGQMRAAESGLTITSSLAGRQTIIERLWPIVSRALYLCADAPDLGGRARPERPKATRTRDGWRVFPADGLRVWPVGERIGAALRHAESAERAAHGDGTHASPRAHIRRAHD